MRNIYRKQSEWSEFDDYIQMFFNENSVSYKHDSYTLLPFFIFYNERKNKNLEILDVLAFYYAKGLK